MDAGEELPLLPTEDESETGEELPPLATEDESENGSAEVMEGPAGGGLTSSDVEAELELEDASPDEVDAPAEVPTAVKLGDEPSVDEATSPGTVRTPAVQLSAEDPEADASG